MIYFSAHLHHLRSDRWPKGLAKLTANSQEICEKSAQWDVKVVRSEGPGIFGGILRACYLYHISPMHSVEVN